MDTESKHFDASKYLDAADGGLAFPCENIAQFGLTQRDYFAAAALTGLLAADNRDEWTPKDTATFAYVGRRHAPGTARWTTVGGF